jgi:hypothetical protein
LTLFTIDGSCVLALQQQQLQQQQLMQSQSNIAARTKANTANRLCNSGSASNNSSSSANTRTASLSKHTAVMNSAKRSAQPMSHLASRVKVHNAHITYYTVNNHALLQREAAVCYVTPLLYSVDA